jgi:hypothetical protein
MGESDDRQVTLSTLPSPGRNRLTHGGHHRRTARARPRLAPGAAPEIVGAGNVVRQSRLEMPRRRVDRHRIGARRYRTPRTACCIGPTSLAGRWSHAPVASPGAGAWGLGRRMMRGYSTVLDSSLTVLEQCVSKGQSRRSARFMCALRNRCCACVFAAPLPSGNAATRSSPVRGRRYIIITLVSRLDGGRNYLVISVSYGWSWKERSGCPQTAIRGRPSSLTCS